MVSRVGKLPIVLPSGVSVTEKNSIVSIKGPHGSSTLELSPLVFVEIEDDRVLVKVKENSLVAQALHGTSRSLLNNAVLGVHKKFEAQLELVGVGFRCTTKGNVMNLSLGFSHQIELPIPKELSVEVENNTSIKILGTNKEQVFQFAAKIRAYRPPEPYNGKGVLYKNENIRRKAGKSGK